MKRYDVLLAVLVVVMLLVGCNRDELHKGSYFGGDVTIEFADLVDEDSITFRFYEDGRYQVSFAENPHYLYCNGDAPAAFEVTIDVAPREYLVTDDSISACLRIKIKRDGVEEIKDFG